MTKLQNKIIKLFILFFVYHVFSVNVFVWLLPTLFYVFVTYPQNYALSHGILFFMFGVVVVFSPEYFLFQKTVKKDKNFLKRKNKIYRKKKWF